MKAVDQFTAAVAGSYAAPVDPEAFVPLDETVAMLRVDGELDELDYSDLVLAEE